jgi:hypothetical protein
MLEEPDTIGAADGVVGGSRSGANTQGNGHSLATLGFGRSSTMWQVLLAMGGALALGACGSEQPPTQPEAPSEGGPLAAAVGTANTWVMRAPEPGGLCEISADLAVDAAGRSTVYTFGGTICNEGGDAESLDAYDVTTDTWRDAGSALGASMNGIGKIGNKFYYSGGITFGGGSEATTFQTNAFVFDAARTIRKADLPKASSGGVTGVINNKVYVLPGLCDGDRLPDPRSCAEPLIRTLFRYDPVTNTWTTLAEAPHNHNHGAGGVIDHKFYVAGGGSNTSPRTATLDVYDPATNSWKTLAPLPGAAPVVGAVVRNKLLVSPGAGTLWSYDPATNVWKTKRGPTFSHETASRVMIDGKAYLLAVGGSHDGFTVPNPSELYTP